MPTAVPSASTVYTIQSSSPPGSSRTSMASFDSNGSRGLGGAKRTLKHIDELKAKIDKEIPVQDLSIKALLLMAGRRWSAALMNIELGRVDLGYVDFNVALEILVNKIPHNKGYPTWVTRQSTDLDEYKKLRKDMVNQLSRVEEIKKTIIADNLANGTQPLIGDGNPIKPTALPTPPAEPKVDSNELPPSLQIKKPPPRPAKPRDLQNYQHNDSRSSMDKGHSRNSSTVSNSDIASLQSGSGIESLQDRFDKLRSAGIGGSTMAGGGRVVNRLPTQTDSATMRRRLLQKTTPLATDESSLPRPPEPTYSPIRQFADNSSYYPVQGESQPRPLARTSSSASLDNFRPASAASAPPTASSPPASIVPMSTGDLTISAERLSEYLGNISEKSVLVIDVRDRSDYDQGHIFTRNIICIEPVALRDNMSAEQLEDALSLSPDKEHTMFLRRHDYDYVVYHDQSTASLTGYDRTADKQAQKALKILVQAIYELAHQKQLKNPPKLLVGGLDAWTEYNGATSLVQTAASQKSSGLARAGAKTATNSQSILAQRRKERTRITVPGQVLPDAERSEILHSAQPIDQEEAAEWIARLQQESATITIKGPVDQEADLKSRNRGISIVSMQDFERSPDVEEFFQRFPALGLDHMELPPVPKRGPPSPPPEGALQQGAAYPVLPVLASRQQITASPAASIDENEQPAMVPTEAVQPLQPAPPPQPLREAPSAPVAPPPIPSKQAAEGGLQRRNTIIDHVFHGFTDVNNPQFNPVPPASPSRPPPAVPKKSYSGVSEHHQPQAPALDPITTPFIAPVTNGGFGTTGLKNLGNTCYMNSIIQCMTGTVPLARYFLSGSYRGHINRENKLGSRGIFAESFANLNRNLWEETYSFVSPVTIKDISGRLNSQFRGRDQQDAQEYLEFFLDYLHEDLNANAGRPKLRDLTDEEEHRREQLPIQLASFLEWQRYEHTNLSMIVKWFQGQFRSRLKCLKCNHTSTTYSPFMYLSLPLPASAKSGGGCSLKDCMDEFTKEEILDGDDAWHCPVCKKPRKASKQLSISRMPIVLIIHLKRFSSQGMWRDKVNTMVNFHKSVDLTRYVPPPLDGNQYQGMNIPATIETTPPFHYSLYGVTNHYGSLTSGHYTAFVRVSGGGAGGPVGAGSVWHKFDDSKATKMESEDVVTRNAYILFWVRNGVM